MAIFLTGAPDARALGWEDTDLTASLLFCFSIETNRENLYDLLDTGLYSVWRFSPFQRQHLPTGISQVRSGPDQRTWSPIDRHVQDETSFLTTDLSYISAEPSEDGQSSRFEDTEETLSQYYEHSYAVHKDIPSSQVIYTRSSGRSSSLSDFLNNCTTSFLDLSATSERKECDRIKPVGRNLMDLEEIPNAAYLRSIAPQTMTVDLIAGIIAVPQPRTIKSRKAGTMLELVEMIVGDETRAGFGINIWLPIALEDVNRTDGLDLQSSIAKLRPQDVVLVRNVALSSFRGRVYGQSLRRDITKLDLLYRNTIDTDDEKGQYDTQALENLSLKDIQVEKLRRVKDWVTAFVGVRMNEASRVDRVREGGNVRTKPLLPPDTQ